MTSTLAASGSCSAWLIRSAATCAGSAVSSASTAISVGPASASMPTTPRSSRLAAVTQMLPGPVIMSTGSQRGDALGVVAAVREHGDRLGAADGVHLVDAEQRAGGEHPGVRQAAVSLCGGLATASEPTPATWAGTTFITTVHGYIASPPGT